MPEQSQGEQYQEIESKFFSYQTAKRINDQTKDLRKKKGKTSPSFIDEVDNKSTKIKKNVDSFARNIENSEEEFKKKYPNEVSKVKNKLKSYKNQAKTQLSSLVDLSIKTFDKPSGSDSITEVRNIFIRTVRKSKSRIQNFLTEEVKKTLGCSQEQTYTPSPVYIPVSSIDIFGYTLQYSPFDFPGSLLYENTPFNPNLRPYSFNRELRHRLDNQGLSYFQEYNTQFIGISNQELFNITYVNKDGDNNDGDFYKVELKNRVTGTNVFEFIGDYYSTIDILNLKEFYTNVLNALTGAIDFNRGFGYDDSREQYKWEIIVQRILGMCFDNKQEIDVSGVGKMDSLDQADENFDELDEIDELLIEEKIKNFLDGVIEYADCGNITFPINNTLLPNLLDPFNDNNLVTSNPDFLAQSMLESLANNPEWKARIPNSINLSAVINKEFLRIVLLSIVNTILSPKHLFPLVVMQKALNAKASTPQDKSQFVRFYRKFLMNLISKISTIFVEELLIEIKKNFKSVVQSLVTSQAQEILNKKKKNVATIITAINIGLTIAAGIRDYRRCQSVVDELKRLLSLTQRLIGINPAQNPLWNRLSFYKPGMSATSMMTRYIESLESNGIDTGDLPNGQPNLALINKKSEMQAHMDEQAENGRVSVGMSSVDVYGLLSGGAPIINLWGTME